MCNIKNEKLHSIITFVFSAVFTSCKVDNEEKYNSSKNLEANEVKNNNIEEKNNSIIESSYCYITSLKKSNNGFIIEVDYIQFLDGDKAISEAKKRGEAEFDISEFGDTVYYVYNDYYIVNDNPKLRTFTINDSTQVNLIEIYEHIFDFNKPKETLVSIQDSPFYLEIENGIVKSLNEIYTP